MLGWLGTPLGRIFQATIGIVLLWSGIAQVTVFGLVVMMTGLITTVLAASPPLFLVPAQALRRQRPPSRT